VRKFERYLVKPARRCSSVSPPTKARSPRPPTGTDRRSANASPGAAGEPGADAADRGDLDTTVVELNGQAVRRLGAKQERLEIVAAATHLSSPEPGALGQVALLARDWFREQL
jgi:hypothetical protein